MKPQIFDFTLDGVTSGIAESYDIPSLGSPIWSVLLEGERLGPFLSVDDIQAYFDKKDGAQDGAQGLTIGGDLSDILRIAPCDLLLDPHRFQYKILFSKSGSTGSLEGVRRWDPDLAGIVLCWLDPEDGSIYVINGHNRVSLAKKIGVRDILIRLLQVSDSREARIKGALANLAEGRGTAIDAAKFLRDSGYDRPTLESLGLPMRERVIDTAIGLSRLSAPLFDRVVQGDILESVAATLGHKIGDHGLQHRVAASIEGKNLTQDVLNNLIEFFLDSQGDQVFTPDLFGGSWEAENFAIEIARLQSHVRSSLISEAKAFGAIAKKSKLLESKAGNKIDVEGSDLVADQNHLYLESFDREKNLAGPLASEVRLWAKKLSSGDRGAMAGCLEAVLPILRSLA